MLGKESPVAIKVIEDAVLTQRQPVGRAVNRHNRLAVVRLQGVRGSGAHQGRTDLHEGFNLGRVDTLKRPRKTRNARP